MFKIIRWSAGSASLSLLSIKVYAISKKEKGDMDSVRAKDLSLYSTPDSVSRFVEEPRSSLEEGISQIRKSLMPYVMLFENAYSQTKPVVDGAIQRGTDSYAYLRNSEVIRRVSVIGFSGVLGYLLGKPSKIKRLLYSFFFMGIVSFAYYPQDSLELMQLCAKKLYAMGLELLQILKEMFVKDVTNNPESEKYSK